MTEHSLSINARREKVDADERMPLLWALRDLLGLTGTKYGCGVGLCGACTVMEDNKAIRACQKSIGECADSKLTTIEGLSPDGSHPVQQAWLTEDVAQCGYCQPGMIMELVALLEQTPDPSEAEIDEALSDHVCRCGSYPRIRAAALQVAKNGARR